MPNTKKIKSKTRRNSKKTQNKTNIPPWYDPKYIKNGRVDWVNYTKGV